MYIFICTCQYAHTHITTYIVSCTLPITCSLPWLPTFCSTLHMYSSRLQLDSRKRVHEATLQVPSQPQPAPEPHPQAVPPPADSSRDGGIATSEPIGAGEGTRPIAPGEGTRPTADRGEGQPSAIGGTGMLESWCVAPLQVTDHLMLTPCLS